MNAAISPKLIHRTRLFSIGIMLLVAIAGAATWLHHVHHEAHIRVALDRLGNADDLSFSGVGIMGRPSFEANDYKLLLAQLKDKAERSFVELFHRGNAPAKAYALTGLASLGSPLTQTLSAELATSSSEVALVHGCIRSEDNLSHIAWAIAHGEPFPYEDRQAALRVSRQASGNHRSTDLEGVSKTGFLSSPTGNP